MSALLTGVARELSRADLLLRAPLPLSRRIGFLAVDGGCGTSTLAAHVATTYAVRRAGPVLAVDASSGAGGLLWQTATTAASAESADPEAADVRTRARTLEEAVRGLDLSPRGLHLLDLRGPDLVAPDLGTWATGVRPSGRFFDVVVSDFGVRRPGEDLVEAASTGHVVGVVTRADRIPAGRGAAAAALLAEQPDGPLPVLVLVDVGRTADRCADGLARELDLPVLVVRHDRARAQPPGQRRLRRGARLDLVRLAASLLVRAEQQRGTTSPGAERAGERANR